MSNDSDIDTSDASLSIPEIDPDADNLSAALVYAKAGWYVLPVDPDTKKPGSIVGKKWQDKSSRDPKVITAWFAGTGYAIALHCGRSGAVVFDVDDPAKAPEVLKEAAFAAREGLPDGCPYQSTRPDQPGRNHYVFAMPPDRTIGNGKGKLRGGWGEVRGLNGVIVVAPSRHSDGGEYRWRRTGVLPVLPDEIAPLLSDASPAIDAANDAVIKSFIEEHTSASRPELEHGWVSALTTKFDDGESRHDSAVSVVAGAMKEARAGYLSAKDVLRTLRKLFLEAVQQEPKGNKQGAKRTEDEASSEWNGIVAWAVGQANGADLDEVRKRTAEKMPPAFEPPKPIITAEPIALSAAHDVFRKWLGADYDIDALDAMLAAAAVERFEDGSDLVWLLVVSGSGNAKTETVQSLNGIGATIASSISSDAALLSGTPKRDRTKTATGGLLRKMGERGVLVIKDVTSILSMDRNLRAKVLAALREVYDGCWVRDIGTDGGQHLEWKGRIAVIGAVTTAWDTAHSVIATMGDRFVLIRVDSTTHRQAAGRRAIRNTGSEKQMRRELSEAAAGVIAGMNTEPQSLTEDEADILLAAADLVTRARTAVEYDYKGDVIDAHAPEMPTRFAKQLAQIMLGGLAIGMERSAALRLAIRCARDSMPPLRLAIIEDLAENAESTPSDVRRRLGKPRSTVDRQLQALHMLGIVTVEELTYGQGNKVHWHYSLSNDVNPVVLNPESSPDLLLTVYTDIEERLSEETF